MTSDGTTVQLEEYLGRMLALGASDLFLRAGIPPSYRVNGQVLRQDGAPPSASVMAQYVQRVLTPMAAERFARTSDVDVAYAVPGMGRFRINLFRHQGNLGLVARLIPEGAIEFSSLGLPAAILAMAHARSGLVLVVGPTGCGKSTTLAALIHHINCTRHAHIVTIEDPIEFVHQERLALVHQRQVGSDTASFASALRHVLRQSPDVILIGEMRDRETVETALAAALTGHLVLSTLHTTNIVQSVDRMLNLFPPEAHRQVQADLAVSLAGMVSMRLLARADGAGRAAATEILCATPTVRRILAEGKLAELYDVMKHGKDTGMMTLNQSLVRLCREGVVTPDEALVYTTNPDEFKLNMDGMFTGIDSIDQRTEAKAKEQKA